MPYKDLVQQRAYREAHKQKITAQKKAWYQLHKDRITAARKVSYLENRETLRRKSREYGYKHRAEHHKYERIYNQKLKLEVLKHYSNGTPKCAHCGETDIDMLCIDHIDNDGAEHRQSINRQSGTSFYRWLRKNNYPKGFQVLCHNHNMKKQLERQRRKYETD